MISEENDMIFKWFQHKFFSSKWPGVNQCSSFGHRNNFEPSTQVTNFNIPVGNKWKRFATQDWTASMVRNLIGQKLKILLVSLFSPTCALDLMSWKENLRHFNHATELTSTKYLTCLVFIIKSPKKSSWMLLVNAFSWRHTIIARRSCRPTAIICHAKFIPHQQKNLKLKIAFDPRHQCFEKTVGKTIGKIMMNISSL